MGAETLASSRARTVAALGTRGHCPSEGRESSPGPCPPRRRSGASSSHLSDRYKAESSRMNLVGRRAEKGPGAAAGGSSLGAAGGGAPRGGQRGLPQETGTRPSLALVSCLYCVVTGSRHSGNHASLKGGST